jgi:hypothetical protein
MIAHPPLTDDAVMLGSRSCSGGLRVGALTSPATGASDDDHDSEHQGRKLAEHGARHCQNQRCHEQSV